MNNEIKEILDKLKDGNCYNELDLTGEMWIELRWEETHLLLDYITNLQQENEKLQEDKKKAVEYIKTTKFLYKSHYDFKQDLLNILQKES